jgi:Pyruvate/2-oxoacid:ferredoxin oxidoreductase delta subunit/flavodoxin
MKFIRNIKKGDTIMKTDIYYFSGTGNSLAIAQHLSKKMEHSTIISIPHVMNTANTITGEIIGIVCPIYFYNMPHIVRDFIKKIQDAKYLFMVYAGTGDLGTGLKATKKLFAAKNMKLSAVFNIPLPDNSTIHVKPEEQQQEMLHNVDKKIEDIVNIVNGKEEHCDSKNTSLIQAYIHPGILYKFIYPGVKKMDKDFTIDERCNGCSICQKVCPVNNITMKENKPVWNKNERCQACLACYNWCPQESIKHVSVNAEMKRYHHPNIAMKDIMSSSAEE